MNGIGIIAIIIIHAVVTPYDGVIKSKITTVHLSVTVLFIPLNIGGLIFALICLVFTIVYRNKK